MTPEIIPYRDHVVIEGQVVKRKNLSPLQWLEFWERQMDNLMLDARAEGYEEGFEAGYEKGKEDAL